VRTPIGHANRNDTFGIDMCGGTAPFRDAVRVGPPRVMLSGPGL